MLIIYRNNNAIILELTCIFNLRTFKLLLLSCFILSLRSDLYLASSGRVDTVVWMYYIDAN